MHGTMIALSAGVLALTAGTVKADNLLVGPPPAAAAVPDVPDGDLGCVVRMLIIYSQTKEVLEDPETDPKLRLSAEKDLALIDQYLAFYLGRVAANPPKFPLDPPMEGRIGTVMSEPSNVSGREIEDCRKFSHATQASTINLIIGQ